MYLGGRVGVVGKNADIFLSNEDEVLKAFGAIIEIFKKYGFRDNRNKNRLHFLLEAVGIEVMAKAIREKAGVDFATAGESMTKVDNYDADQGKVQLRDGSFGVHVVVPSGIFSGSAMMEVANLASTYGNGEIRLDMEQSLYILGVKDTTSLLKEKFFESYKSKNTPYFNHLIACAGTEHCPFGVIENKNDAISMATYLDEKVSLASGRVRMYWSACVKGCGIHGLGDIGFEGCKAKIDGQSVDGVNISIGGKLVREGCEGHTVIKSSPLKYARYFVESLMLEYQKLSNDKESFESFYDRVLSNYTYQYIGFYMQLMAYIRAKNIDLILDIDKVVNTGKNEEFEIFELGRKIYHFLTKEEPFTSYDRFTNKNKREKVKNLKKVLPNIDENLADMLFKMLTVEDERAEVFSELTSFIKFDTI